MMLQGFALCNASTNFFSSISLRSITGNNLKIEDQIDRKLLIKATEDSHIHTWLSDPRFPYEFRKAMKSCIY